MNHDQPTLRLGRGIYAYERALARSGIGPVAGADEAGRGACAGPLVAAAVVLDPRSGRALTCLNDSKLLSPAARERAYDEIMAKAVSVAWVSVSATECDELGMHVADIQALRRALLRLDVAPQYVLTDGFGVDGLGVSGLGVWKGDRVCACVAAASIVAKVTRDRIMRRLDDVYPEYGFGVHKGYCTSQHQRALDEHGPSPEHRMRYDNVAKTVRVGAA